MEPLPLNWGFFFNQRLKMGIPMERNNKTKKEESIRI